VALGRGPKLRGPWAGVRPWECTPSPELRRRYVPRSCQCTAKRAVPPRLLCSWRGFPVADGLPQLDENGGSARELEKPKRPMLAQHRDPECQRQRYDQDPGRPMPPSLTSRGGKELERVSPSAADGLRESSDVHAVGSYTSRRRQPPPLWWRIHVRCAEHRDAPLAVATYPADRASYILLVDRLGDRPRLGGLGAGLAARRLHLKTTQRRTRRLGGREGRASRPLMAIRTRSSARRAIRYHCRPPPRRRIHPV
jgi:hypothetical protein